MPRKPRTDYAGAFHHAMNRGADHAPIFRDDYDRVRFLRLMATSFGDHGLETLAYCLMGNHYHLLVRSTSGGLSRSMKSLSQLYTLHFNRRYDRDGALFRGRFASKEVTTNSYLLQASRYIHRNPLPIVQDRSLLDYRWSSLQYYVGESSAPTWLHPDPVLDQFSATAPGPQTYASFVMDSASPTARWAPPVMSGPGMDLLTVDSPRDQQSPGVSPLETLALIVSHLACSDAWHQLQSVGRGEDLERSVQILVGSTIASVSTTELANQHGLSPSGVRSAIARFRRRLAADQRLANLVSQAKSELDGTISGTGV